jgi:hypothetical protein
LTICDKVASGNKSRELQLVASSIINCGEFFPK